MGKGVIVSSLGDAAYEVRIIKDVTRVDAAKARCVDGIAAAELAIAVAEQAETNARDLITAIGEQLDAAIVAAEGNSADPVVLALQKKQTAAADKLESAQHDLAQAKLKKLSYEKELATYDGIAGEETRELWCADATDDLAAGTEVGTIEINQETTSVLVAPGGAASADILQPGMANDALATFYNWGILPGVQRHKPTYRLGTIKEIDYDADTAMVCLDDARSSAQNIKINPTGTPCEVQKDGPSGFVDFCASNPDHPACQSNGSTQQSYTADLKATLDEINKRINESNAYVYDSEKYGKLENWTEMRQYGDSGDCEDFALAKYRACLNAGIPASALKLVTGKASNGQGHAWLEVQTDQGNVALDLNTQAATFSDELPYSNRSVQADGTNWSGKGLLLEDVPVKYMECDAAAFKPDDRVVVHFEDADWSKPRVFGFEEKPEHCGDILCIYMDGPDLMASRLSISLPGDRVRASDPKPANEYMSVSPSLDMYSYIKTFSKRFKIGQKYFYIFATPASESGFIYNSIYDYPVSKTYQNNYYYYIYDPEKKTSYKIPIQGHGIGGRWSCFNISGDTFYTCSVETPNNRFIPSGITFSAVEFFVNAKGEIEFKEPNESTVSQEYFYSNVSPAMFLARVSIDNVTKDGIFTIVLNNYVDNGYPECTAVAHGVISFNIKTGIFSGDISYYANETAVFQTCPSIVGDEIVSHDCTYSRSSAYDGKINFDGNEFSWATIIGNGGSPQLNTVNKVYANRFKIPMGREAGQFSQKDFRKCFYRYFMVTYYVYEGYPSSLYGIHTPIDRVVTPFETIDNNENNEVFGLSYIERHDGSAMQALVFFGDDGIATDIVCYYNGNRVDSQIATALGVPKTNIIGFIHRPRQ